LRERIHPPQGEVHLSLKLSWCWETVFRASKGSLKHGRAIGTGALIAIMRGMEKKELDSKETSFYLD
jgi:hypothetical protein